jgi:hypothetical protein
MDPFSCLPRQSAEKQNRPPSDPTNLSQVIMIFIRRRILTFQHLYPALK